MNLEMLKASGKIVYEVVAGSHAYNLHTPKSDRDIRGVFRHDREDYLRLAEPVEQVGDEKHDTVYYSLKRFFELAMKANPNILELLWMPEETVISCDPVMRTVIDNRKIFLSQKVFHTFSGYAYAQIQKAKGQNKMVNHPEMAEKPLKEDYCWIVPVNNYNGDFDKEATEILAATPCRPVPLKHWRLDIGNFHCSKMEHMNDTYRLYDYTLHGSKGVFRGDDMLVVESIPLEDEKDRFYGLLIYQKHLYDKAMVEHRRYVKWMETRNENRWIDQEKGLVSYDAKNMMHCFRLLMSGISLLECGEPIVRFEGEDREFLMKIRRGECEYESLMEDVERRMDVLRNALENTSLPHSVNFQRIEGLFQGVMEMS